MSSENPRLGWPTGGYSPIEKYHSQPYAAISPTLPALSAVGKNVLITGGGSGIGFAIMKAFATAGASHITIIGRTATLLESAKLSIESFAPMTNISTYAISLTDHDAVKSMFASERSLYGEFDVVILCAGYLHTMGSALDISDEDYHNSFDLNVHGNIHLTQQYLQVKPTIEKPKTVVDISSGAVHNHTLIMATYAITKIAFSTYLSHLDLEFRDVGLRTFSVHPGSVYTGMPQRAGMKESDVPFDHGMFRLVTDR